MVDLDILKIAIELEAEDILIQQKKAEKKLEIKHKKELEKQKLEYERQIAQAGDSYQKNAAAEILSQLRIAYDILQRRSSLQDFSSEELRKAQETLELKRTIAEDKQNPSSQAFLKYIDLNTNDRIRNAIEIISNGDIDSRDITSYISLDREKILIVSPIGNNEEKQLPKNLEQRLLDTLILGNVDIALTRRYDHKSLQVVGVEKGIDFTADDVLANDFLVFTITPNKPEEINRLADDLIEKITKLQPAGFVQAKLENKFYVVDPKIIEYFKTHSMENIYTPQQELQRRISEGKTTISYEEAIKLTGKSMKALRRSTTTGRLNKTESGEIEASSLIGYLTNQNKPRRGNPQSNKLILAESSEEARIHVYKRLEELGRGLEAIDGNQLSYVLGINPSSGPTVFAKKPEVQNCVIRTPYGSGIRERIHFKVNELKSLLSRGKKNYKGGWEFS